MLVTSSPNPVPKVGQLFYVEYQSEDEKFQNSSILFIDEKPEEGKQWMFTQIALLEDIEGEITAYAGFEAGGMPPKYTGLATDEDISKFIKHLKSSKNAEDSPNFDDWLKKVSEDSILLKEEKERIVRLSSAQ